MRLVRAALFSAFGLAAVITPRDGGAGSKPDPSGRADRDAMAARPERPVARVGTREVTAAELRDRIGRMPEFQRATYGDTADAIRRGVLVDVLSERLLSLAAENEGVERAPAIVFALRRTRASSVVRALRARLGGPRSIAEDRVREYFGAHRDRYESPDRIQIWRILCKTEEEARSVLDTCKRDPTPRMFSDLAREHSQDKATYLRGGNLGFVAPDGASSFADFHVDPALVRAAAGVHDGELVPAPVAEGPDFAVVWRRGTIAAVHRTVDQVGQDIRALLYEAAVRDQTERRIMDLRAARLRDLDASPLEGLPDDVRTDAQ